MGRFDGSWIRDNTGRLVARYDGSDDRTRNTGGKVIGSGDLRLLELGRKQKG